jgi:uncharacterized protein
VCDTNVLLSAFVLGLGPPGQIVNAWLAGTFDLILSGPILIEFTRNIHKPYFVSRLTPHQISDAITALLALAIQIPITTTVSGVATHPEDDLVLATALSYPATYLVTGDRKLQNLGSYQGVTILGPRAFVETVLARLRKP